MSDIGSRWISLPVECTCCGKKWVAAFDFNATTISQLKCPACKQRRRCIGVICTVLNTDYVVAMEYALLFYSQDHLYDMNGFLTSPAVQEVGKLENIWIDGNPIMHDRGKRARFALLWGKEA